MSFVFVNFHCSFSVFLTLCTSYAHSTHWSTRTPVGLCSPSLLQFLGKQSSVSRRIHLWILCLSRLFTFLYFLASYFLLYQGITVFLLCIYDSKKKKYQEELNHHRDSQIWQMLQSFPKLNSCVSDLILSSLTYKWHYVDTENKVHDDNYVIVIISIYKQNIQICIKFYITICHSNSKNFWVMYSETCAKHFL